MEDNSKTLRILIDETLKGSVDRSEAKSKIVKLSGLYMGDIACYRFIIGGETLDFPSGWLIFPDAPKAFRIKMRREEAVDFFSIVENLLRSKIVSAEFLFSEKGQAAIICNIKSL